jgi:hypothetical protein
MGIQTRADRGMIALARVSDTGDKRFLDRLSLGFFVACLLLSGVALAGEDPWGV